MPSTSTTKHPILDITLRFTEVDHRYVDSDGVEYESVTTMVKSAFPSFDAVAVSAKCAEKQGRTPESLQAEWKAKAEAASEWGTRFHANMEATLKGQSRPNPPRNEREIAAMKSGVEVCKKLMARFGKNLWPEKIVFSPFYRKAGTLDLLATKGTDAFIFDWKTNEIIQKSNEWETSHYWALSKIESCDFEKYSLQLSAYQRILLRELYLPPNTNVKRMLIWMGADGCSPEFIETLDRNREVAEIMLEQAIVERVCK